MLMTYYECAILEVKTKLDVLNKEFQANELRNPIETIKTRIKSPASIMEKLERKGFELSVQSIKDNLDDVAGIRVICSFVDDIYKVADMLTNQDDIKILSKKDYIRNPKKNGYRSLHLVVEIPIFLSNEKKPMRVEVQIRTIAMDFWASLEHEIHYKKFSNSNVEAVKQLTECADVIYETDMKMLKIRKNLLDEED
ncbi:GTP pyrophosphokinase family protein [Eubacterium ventriosum]|nr:GTP pyrophosphokinase family protein [Eubacterium ventriosum]MCC2789294.1 GTP pyrophosphokinase family protein [Eubacterium ventriosum]UWP37235.1 GTP pyrophosphokinase family protein [Eubacterium ventriosum]